MEFFIEVEKQVLNMLYARNASVWVPCMTKNKLK